MIITIVYDSGYGHTERVAKYVAQGASKVAGTDVKAICVNDGFTDWERLEKIAMRLFSARLRTTVLSAQS